MTHTYNISGMTCLGCSAKVKSKLLMHPLAEEAGGDDFHGGGHHWKSQDDPEWQTMAAWVRGQK